jgi:hypothetical protein
MGARYRVELEERLELPSMDVQTSEFTTAMGTERMGLAPLLSQFHNNIFHK